MVTMSVISESNYLKGQIIKKICSCKCFLPLFLFHENFR